jgi:hypothetical protein
MVEKRYPTFIVAGGVRCATGWIRECLSEHPEIYMQKKETHFFDQNYDKGQKWYSEFFKFPVEATIIGEKTASYLHYENVARNIKEILPNVKLIFCLRDPIERMYSHYSMSASYDKKIEEIGFLNSVEKDSKYLEWGRYSKQLYSFFSQFPRKNILIKIYEDREIDPYDFMSTIYEFVGADRTFKAPSTTLRTKLGQMEHDNQVWGIIAKGLLHPRAPKILRSFYTKIRPSDQRSISDEIFKRFSHYYGDDILHLEKLLERDLNIWRTKGNVG